MVKYVLVIQIDPGAFWSVWGHVLISVRIPYPPGQEGRIWSRCPDSCPDRYPIYSMGRVFWDIHGQKSLSFTTPIYSIEPVGCVRIGCRSILDHVFLDFGPYGVAIGYWL
jgi:hypothetical protein